ncbi:hypothetical protein HPB50_015185 [Hyalomma asiaticum]|uniref:Uncharacterized protein n=1 Tax=Hyalomma asiaticum TaxID=266040 RepID=A0ACB7SNQ2_HYAAI|nr:hypothetical protein HPB50_015185 [Hyalomma asiaticum]
MPDRNDATPVLLSLVQPSQERSAHRSSPRSEKELGDAKSGAKEQQYAQWACFMPAAGPRKCRQQPLKALFPAPEASRRRAERKLSSPGALSGTPLYTRAHPLT